MRVKTVQQLKDWIDSNLKSGKIKPDTPVQVYAEFENVSSYPELSFDEPNNELLICQ
jgi:hypothetical protein